MCLMIYLSANETLPEFSWRQSGYLSVHRATRIPRSLRKKLTKQFLYVVGAKGCACAFMRDDPDPQSQEDALRANRDLADYLDSLDAGGSVEIYSVWTGGEGGKINHTGTVTTGDIRSEEFEFLEDQLLYVLFE